MLKKLSKDVLIYGLVGGFGKSLMLVLVPIYTRVFSTVEYGFIDLISSTMAFFTIIGMFQMEASSGRYFFEVSESNRVNYISTAFWSIFFWTCIICLPIIIFSKSLSELFFNGPFYSKIIVLGCFIVILGNLFYYLMAMMRYVRKPKAYGAISIFQITITLLTSVLFVIYFKTGVIGVFYGQFLGFLVSLIVLVFLMLKWKLISFAWQINVLVKHLKYNIPLIPGLIGGWLSSYFNRYILLGMMSYSEVGLLALGMKVASVFQLIEQSIKMTWSPFVFENLKNIEHKKLFRKVLRYLSFCVFSFTCLVIIFMEELFKLLVPSEYLPAVPLTIILCVAFAIHIHQQIIVVGPGIVKKTGYNSIFNLLGGIISLGSLYLFIPYFGLIGVAFSTLLAYLFTIFVGWYYSEKLYYVGYSITQFLIPLSFTLLLALAIINFNLSQLNRVLMSLVIFIVSILVAVKEMASAKK